MLLDVPVARDGAAPITGLVRTEFIADRVGDDDLSLERLGFDTQLPRRRSRYVAGEG